MGPGSNYPAVWPSPAGLQALMDMSTKQAARLSGSPLLCFQETKKDHNQGIAHNCVCWALLIPSGILQGSWPFCVPHFFDYREQPSCSLHDLAWVPKGRFKQLLMREGRGCETQEKQTIKRSLGVRFWFLIKAYTQPYLWAILQSLKPPPSGRN